MNPKSGEVKENIGILKEIPTNPYECKDWTGGMKTDLAFSISVSSTQLPFK